MSTGDQTPHHKAVNTAFVLSGGGNLGALQVGMLRALVENDIHPDLIVGTSIGAINGAFFAGRPDLVGIDEIVRCWSSLRRRDVLGVSAATLINGLLGHSGSLFRSAPMRQVVESFVTYRAIEDAPVKLAIVATDLATGKPVILESGDVTTALLASCAIPNILPPVTIGGRLLIDGAVSADIPLREAASLGAREIYVIPTAPLQVERLRAQEWWPTIRDELTVQILTPPSVYVPLGELRHSERLVELGYADASAWIPRRPRHSAQTSPPEGEIDCDLVLNRNPF